MTLPSPIGIFGGTFDPPHFGHLRPALELIEALGLQQMRLVPSHLPPHRPQPQASATQRLAMLTQASADEPRFQVDNCEILRSGPSYTVDTLRAMRKQWPDTPLCLCLGMDAFLGLTQWYHWQEVQDLAHVVVSYRPGWELASHTLDAELQQYLQRCQASDVRELGQQLAGKIWLQQVSQLAISATDIRQRIANERSARYLLPETVWKYIQQQRLYTNKESQ